MKYQLKDVEGVRSTVPKVELDVCIGWLLAVWNLYYVIRGGIHSPCPRPVGASFCLDVEATPKIGIMLLAIGKKSCLTSSALSLVRRKSGIVRISEISKLCFQFSHFVEYNSKDPATKEILIRSRSVCIKYNYWQNEGAEWRCNHFLPYHVLYISKDVKELDAFSFACRAQHSIEADREDDDAVDGKEEVPQDRYSRDNNDTYKVHAISIPHEDYLAIRGLLSI